ncbi:MAG: hypothetical protein ACOC2H_04940 [Spirochaetota bacterium]
MNDTVETLAGELRDLIADSSLYQSYVHLRNTVESDEDLAKTYRELVEVGKRLKAEESVDKSPGSTVPTAVKQFIAVQKELSAVLNGVLEEMQKEIR